MAAEVEHGQGDEGLGGLEAERDAGDEADGTAARLGDTLTCPTWGLPLQV